MLSGAPARRTSALIGGLLLALLMMRLGFWQLDRADQKKQLHERFAARATATPLSVSDSSSDQVAHELWRPARISGSALAPALLLDNRVRDGVPGYEVLAPIRLDDARTVLLNRGWLAAPARRDRWPEILPMQHLENVKVRIAPAPSTGISLAAFSLETGPGDISRIQRLDFPALSVALKLPLEPYQLLLDADQADGYDRRWLLPSPDAGKHQAYAAQWFAMAGVLLILMAFYGFRRSTPNPAETP